MLEKFPRQISVGTADIQSRERGYISNVLDSGRITYGPMSAEFEELWGKLHGVRYAIFVNSGTSALRIAIAALKELHRWRDGDEILCPAVTFVSSANVIVMNGFTPVFVDVDPVTYNIDPEKIEAAITKRTRAIMVVHLFGQSAEMNPIMAIARRHKLRVIEDACESPLAQYRGRPVGSFGDISCFSTYQAHVITTGVGGFACTNHARYAEVMKSLANHGRDGIYLHIDDDKGLSRHGLFRVVARRFRFLRLGYSFRATEFEAALGLGQLKRRGAILRARRRNAAYLIRRLAPYARYLQLPQWPRYTTHSFMMFPIVIRPHAGTRKRTFVNYLEEHNIETRDMLPLVNQPVYRKMFGPGLENRYPVARWINRNGFYIGCHQRFTGEELRYVIRAFADFFRARGFVSDSPSP